MVGVEAMTGVLARARLRWQVNVRFGTGVGHDTAVAAWDTSSTHHAALPLYWVEQTRVVSPSHSRRIVEEVYKVRMRTHAVKYPRLASSPTV